MPDIESRSGLHALKKRLESLRSSVNIPQLSDAIRGVLTAVNCADKTLLASSVDSLVSCLAELGRDVIRDEVTKSQEAIEVIRNAWREHIDGSPAESFDGVKDLIESLIDERIAGMTKVRDQMVNSLAEKGCHIDNAQQLEDSIRSLREFRAGILKEWPSQNKPPSLLNRKVIAEAREAIARRERPSQKRVGLGQQSGQRVIQRERRVMREVIVWPAVHNALWQLLSKASYEKICGRLIEQLETEYDHWRKRRHSDDETIFVYTLYLAEGEN